MRRPSNVVLDLTYNEIARRLLLHQQPEEIAQAMNLNLSTLKQALRRPDFRKVLQELKDKTYEGVDKAIESDVRNIRQEIVDMAGPSLNRLKTLLEHAASEGIQKDVAQDFLDRAGYSKAPETKPAIQVIISPIEADVIATALQKEKEGRQRLENLELQLAKKAKEVEHPALKPSKQPSD